NFNYTNFDDLKPVSSNTIYLLAQSAENLSIEKQEPSNVPLIRRKQVDELMEGDRNTAIVEQFDLIQKVAYDIYKLTEKIHL
ncbi:MAG: FUSC family protein, partial [Bacteroidia bacterium]